MIREKHAHAWVEAYIPPDQCTQEMFDNGSARRGGAWLTLDPTGGIYREESVVTTGDSLELARNLWQDYVLGMDAENQAEPIMINSSQILGLMDISNWQAFGQRAADEFKSRTGLRFALIGLLVAFVGLIIYRALTANRRLVQSRSKPPVSRLRRLVGGALYWISPELGTWVIGDVYVQRIVPFYERMIHNLQRNHQLQRTPDQTHREFAVAVGQHFAKHPGAQIIGPAVLKITDAFYQVRFGNRTLDNQGTEQIEKVAQELEQQLKITSLVASDQPRQV